MIQMMINLGKWLEQRFPKIVQVTEADYKALKEDIKYLSLKIDQVTALAIKVETIESNAVHKEPVKALIEEMAKMKAEITSLRAGLGITASAASPEAMEAMLNGEYINGGSNAKA